MPERKSLMAAKFKVQWTSSSQWVHLHYGSRKEKNTISKVYAAGRLNLSRIERSRIRQLTNGGRRMLPTVPANGTRPCYTADEIKGIYRPDDIPTSFLIALGSRAETDLLAIFNCSFATGQLIKASHWPSPNGCVTSFQTDRLGIRLTENKVDWCRWGGGCSKDEYYRRCFSYSISMIWRPLCQTTSKLQCLQLFVSLFCSHPCKLSVQAAMQEAVKRVAEWSRNQKMMLKT